MDDKKLGIEPFDPAEYVRDDDEAALYLNDAMASGDPNVVAAAMGTIARARGATKLAKAAGVSREAIYKGLSSGGNPTLATIMAVMKELGLEMSVHAASGR